MLELLFDWDQWNIQRNEIKHGVSSLEAESAFGDTGHVVFNDMKHSSKTERRFVLLGRSLENRVLMIGLTMRRARFRIITARPASRAERKIYEEDQDD